MRSDEMISFHSQIRAVQLDTRRILTLFVGYPSGFRLCCRSLRFPIICIRNTTSGSPGPTARIAQRRSALGSRVVHAQSRTRLTELLREIIVPSRHLDHKVDHPEVERELLPDPCQITRLLGSGRGERVASEMLRAGSTAAEITRVRSRDRLRV